jgi:hypothetical protein
MSTLYEDVKKRDEAKTEVSANAGSGQETTPAVTYIDSSGRLTAPTAPSVAVDPKPIPATVDVAPQPQPQPKTMLELVQLYGKPQSYEEEIADAARRKRLGNWADVVANLADLGTGLAGRRLYSPTNKSAAAEADKRLIKLRELQRGDNLRYNNALMDARYKDIQQERADKAAAAEAARKAQERADKLAAQEATNKLKEKELELKGEIAKAEAGRKAQQDADTKAYRNDMMQFRRGAQKENADIKRERTKTLGERRARGKQIGFSDGAGNNVAIYDNVWRGSMQSVYDALLEDLAAESNEGRDKYIKRIQLTLTTPEAKEDFVKQNWYKSQKAKSIMSALSRLDPATMESDVILEYDPDDDIVDYDPNND